jgi:predicted RNA binding protein YcfA (HicA-like mRNA interferase family)
MPKLPVLTSKEFLKILQKIGFKIDHISGSHYILRNPANNKRITIPFHLKDLPPGTVNSILKSVGVSRDDLKKYR